MSVFERTSFRTDRGWATTEARSLSTADVSRLLASLASLQHDMPAEQAYVAQMGTYPSDKWIIKVEWEGDTDGVVIQRDTKQSDDESVSSDVPYGYIRRPNAYDYFPMDSPGVPETLALVQQLWASGAAVKVKQKQKKRGGRGGGSTIQLLDLEPEPTSVFLSSGPQGSLETYTAHESVLQIDPPGGVFEMTLREGGFQVPASVSQVALGGAKASSTRSLEVSSDSTSVTPEARAPPPPASLRLRVTGWEDKGWISLGEAFSPFSGPAEATVKVYCDSYSLLHVELLGEGLSKPVGEACARLEQCAEQSLSLDLDELVQSSCMRGYRTTGYKVTLVAKKVDSGIAKVDWLDVGVAFEGKEWTGFLNEDLSRATVIRCYPKAKDGYIGSALTGRPRQKGPSMPNMNLTSGAILVGFDDAWSQRPLQALLDQYQVTRRMQPFSWTRCPALDVTMAYIDGHYTYQVLYEGEVIPDSGYPQGRDNKTDEMLAGYTESARSLTRTWVDVDNKLVLLVLTEGPHYQGKSRYERMTGSHRMVIDISSMGNGYPLDGSVSPTTIIKWK